MSSQVLNKSFIFLYKSFILNKNKMVKQIQKDWLGQDFRLKKLRQTAVIGNSLSDSYTVNSRLMNPK